MPSSIIRQSNCGESAPCKTSGLPHLHFSLIPRYPFVTFSQLEYGMNEYQLGGGLSLLTALGKTNAFAEFLQTRMAHAVETRRSH